MKPMEEILVPNPNNLSTKPSSSSSFERRVKPQKAAAVNCPRCDSTNTKFCYYNNYSLSQPRYFCKTCRRYWTEGGTLRNIPVGGGSRKNKRSSSISSTNVSATTSSYNSSVSKSLPDLLGSPSATTVPLLSQNPRIHHGQYGQDLNLGFASTSNLTNFSNVSEFLQVPNFDAANGIATSGAMNLFMPVPIPIPIPDPNSVYGIPEFRIPSLSFSLDGIGPGGGGSGGGGGNGLDQSEGGRLLFPFEEVKTDTSTTDHDDLNERKDQNCDSNGFWNGMMGAGSW